MKDKKRRWALCAVAMVIPVVVSIFNQQMPQSVHWVIPFWILCITIVGLCRVLGGYATRLDKLEKDVEALRSGQGR